MSITTGIIDAGARGAAIPYSFPPRLLVGVGPDTASYAIGDPLQDRYLDAILYIHQMKLIAQSHPPLM